MSAILSADDLNDFISPGVTCIKPVETLPKQQPIPDNPYEVTTEDKLPEQTPPAQISLTDCLACSGCVTSAEAILVSLQSHAEVLNALDMFPPLSTKDGDLAPASENVAAELEMNKTPALKGKVFVASVSPQVRASIAATYGSTEQEAGWMIDQLLSGPLGLASGGNYGNKFSWIIDTNAMREVCLVKGAEEVFESSGSATTQQPILTSACPGWVCYAEKTHPHVLPHFSRLKSPQALTGILVKSILSKRFGISPDQIWHLAIMPCFDKKLEGARQELTSRSWQPTGVDSGESDPVRDVDCVITAREILMLADSRGISFPGLPRRPLDSNPRDSFPDKRLANFLFPLSAKSRNQRRQQPDSGSSGGFLYHILRTQQLCNPGSIIQSQRGRNADVIEYTVSKGEEIVFRAARYYGFRNIQNLVRKLRSAKTSRLPGKRVLAARQPSSKTTLGSSYSYVEVMACPGGCTNGGGQIKLDDLGSLQGKVTNAQNQRQWLSLVDEAYYSMEEEDSIGEDETANNVQDLVDEDSRAQVKAIVDHWQSVVGVAAENLLWTSYREVESDVGKPKKDTERVVELASKIGGGW